MSDALNRVRRHFQDELLVPIGKKMVPTPLAESLRQPLRNILLQVESVTSSTVQFDPTKSKRKLTVMASDYVSDVLLDKVILNMYRQAPGMQIELKNLTSSFVNDFERGQIDLLITPESYVSQSHPSEPLFEDPFTCAVWSGNKTIGEKLSFEQYKDAGHICVNLGDWRVPTHEEWVLKRYGNVRKIEVVVSTFGKALQLIAGTNRIVTCHVRHAKLYSKTCSLRLLKPPFAIPPQKLSMQWHKYKDSDPALLWFRSALKATAALR
jgi:DNA-binding transcriptional LysR family regulator